MRSVVRRSIKTLSRSLSAGVPAAVPSRTCAGLASAVSPAADGSHVHVMKFSGSQLDGAIALKQIADSIREAEAGDDKLVVVLSALAGVTNSLYKILQDFDAGASVESLKDDISALLSLHAGTATDLLGPQASRQVIENIELALEHHLLGRLRYAREREGPLVPLDRDIICSLGERFSAYILTEYLSEHGLQDRAALVPAEQVIVTDGKPGASMPLMAETQSKARAVLAPMLAQGTVPIVPGFYGGSIQDGAATTLGRKGGDLSAAMLGYALDAEGVDLYHLEQDPSKATFTQANHSFSDQREHGASAPGRAGDPARSGAGASEWRADHNGSHSDVVENLTYEAAEELCALGQDAVHRGSVGPLRRKGIPFTVASSLGAEDEDTTTIQSEVDLYGNEGAVGGEAPAHAAGGAGQGWAVEDRVSAVHSIAVPEFERRSNRPLAMDWEQLPPELERDASTIVPLVGSSLMRDQKRLRKLTSRALQEAGVKFAVPQRVTGSEHSFSVVVPKGQEGSAVAALQDTFLNASEDSSGTEGGRKGRS